MTCAVGMAKALCKQSGERVGQTEQIRKTILTFQSVTFCLLLPRNEDLCNVYGLSPVVEGDRTAQHQSVHGTHHHPTHLSPHSEEDLLVLNYQPRNVQHLW